MGVRLIIVITLIFFMVCHEFVHAAGPKCFRCERVSEVHDCEVVTQCQDHEQCYSEMFVTDAASVFWSLGCSTDRACNKLSNVGKRSMHILHQRDNLALCQQCCKGDYCNRAGCTKNGQPTPDYNNGTLCYQCAGENEVSENFQCETLRACAEHEECYYGYGLTTQAIPRVEMKCIEKNICDTLYKASPDSLGQPHNRILSSSSLLVGRGISNEAQLAHKEQRRSSSQNLDGGYNHMDYTLCQYCCKGHYCNSRHCNLGLASLPTSSVPSSTRSKSAIPSSKKGSSTTPFHNLPTAHTKHTLPTTARTTHKVQTTARTTHTSTTTARTTHTLRTTVRTTQTLPTTAHTTHTLPTTASTTKPSVMPTPSSTTAPSTMPSTTSRIATSRRSSAVNTFPAGSTRKQSIVPAAGSTPSTSYKTTTPKQLTLECEVCRNGHCAYKTCSGLNPYCVNLLYNNKDGTRTVIQRCGTEYECETQWFNKTAQDDLCTVFDPYQVYHSHFKCTYCCVRNYCNKQIVPPLETLYYTNWSR